MFNEKTQDIYETFLITQKSAHTICLVANANRSVESAHKFKVMWGICEYLSGFTVNYDWNIFIVLELSNFTIFNQKKYVLNFFGKNYL